MVVWHIAMALELAMASFLEASHLFGSARLPPTGPLCAEAFHHACDVINMTTRVREKPDMYSPHRTFYGRAPFARLLPFQKPGFHVKKDSEVGARGESLLLPERRQQQLA